MVWSLALAASFTGESPAGPLLELVESRALGAWEVPLRAGKNVGERSGLQRLHARKPSRSASCGVEKNTILARLARREGQVGRQ